MLFCFAQDRLPWGQALPSSPAVAACLPFTAPLALLGPRPAAPSPSLLRAVAGRQGDEVLLGAAPQYPTLQRADQPDAGRCRRSQPAGHGRRRWAGWGLHPAQAPAASAALHSRGPCWLLAGRVGLRCRGAGAATAARLSSPALLRTPALPHLATIGRSIAPHRAGMLGHGGMGAHSGMSGHVGMMAGAPCRGAGPRNVKHSSYHCQPSPAVCHRQQRRQGLQICSLLRQTAPLQAAVPPPRRLTITIRLHPPLPAGGVPMGMPMAAAGAQALIHGGGQGGGGGLGHAAAASPMLPAAGQGGGLDHSHHQASKCRRLASQPGWRGLALWGVLPDQVKHAMLTVLGQGATRLKGTSCCPADAASRRVPLCTRAELPSGPVAPRPRPQLQMAGMPPYAMPYAGSGGMHSSMAFFGAGTVS